MRDISDFLGRYSLARVIDDTRAGAQAQFEGEAVLEATPDGALYRERGDLVMNGERFAAEREYIWHAEGALILVRFADGRDFHSFDPSAGGLASEHLCGEDMYRGGYDLSAWPGWSVTWDVFGPRKDYRSVSQYRPLR